MGITSTSNGARQQTQDPTAPAAWASTTGETMRCEAMTGEARRGEAMLSVLKDDEAMIDDSRGTPSWRGGGHGRARERSYGLDRDHRQRWPPQAVK
jgi:hypothetical protein